MEAADQLMLSKLLNQLVGQSTANIQQTSRALAPIPVQTNANNTGLTKVQWALPRVGATVYFSVMASNGAQLRLFVKSGGAVVFDSKDLGDGQQAKFTWPANASIVLSATSGANVSGSEVKGNLVAGQ